MEIGLHASRFHTCRGTCSWAQTVRISPWHNSRSRGQCLIGIVIDRLQKIGDLFSDTDRLGILVDDLLTGDKDLSRVVRSTKREYFFSLSLSRAIFTRKIRDRFLFRFNIITFFINCCSRNSFC